MNRRSSSLSQKERTHPRFAGAGLTQQQKIILILVGLLVTAWVVVAIGFLLSTGASFAQNTPYLQIPSNQQLSSPDSPTNSTLPGPVNQPVSAIPISAACAQKYSGVQEGTVSRVEDSGLLQISTTNGVLHAGFAGIELLPAGQPGEKVLQTIREMVENQPVLLVRDLSAQDGTGQSFRYVFTQQQFINDELVRQGLAVVDLDSPSQSCAATFQLAEQKARSERLGVWKPVPVPTRTFVPFVTLDASNQPACDCSKRYECSDFTTHADAQACYNACNDYNSRLDADRDGLACEELP